MSETLEFPWTTTDRRGRTKLVSNRDFPVETDNPHVSQELSDWFEEISTKDREAFYGVAYLLSEYGNQIAEEVDELPTHELRDYVIGIELARSKKTGASAREHVQELLDNANDEEQSRILNAAESSAKDHGFQGVPSIEELIDGE